MIYLVRKGRRRKKEKRNEREKERFDVRNGGTTTLRSQRHTVKCYLNVTVGHRESHVAAERIGSSVKNEMWDADRQGTLSTWYGALIARMIYVFRDGTNCRFSNVNAPWRILCECDILETFRKRVFLFFSFCLRRSFIRGLRENRDLVSSLINQRRV